MPHHSSSHNYVVEHSDLKYYSTDIATVTVTHLKAEVKHICLSWLVHESLIPTVDLYLTYRTDSADWPFNAVVLICSTAGCLHSVLH